LLAHQCVITAADGNFLGFGHHHEILLAGDRILGAPGEGQQGQADKQDFHRADLHVRNILDVNKKGSVRCLLIITWCLISSGRGLGACLAIFLVELLDTAGGVDDFLRAGIKRMAFGTDFDVQRLSHGGPGLEGIATAAGDGKFVILRMDIGFHVFFLA
jgi:hypothetical protein